MIEQSDELDRFLSQAELVKQLKHQSLVGDLNKLEQLSATFLEQSEQLVEICKMLNQVSSSNKMKIGTKSLAIWFEQNTRLMLSSVRCVAESPRSRVAKDCAWAYLQGE